jgi:starvation-inducible DNA-binding protein
MNGAHPTSVHPRSVHPRSVHRPTFMGATVGYSRAMTSDTQKFTTPGLTSDEAEETVAILQDRLYAATDLHLTLKHVHWNVVGPQFIAVHEMLDPQVDAVRAMADVLAERIATLGGVPVGTPGALVANRGWDDYSLHRAGTQAHLEALDVTYRGIIESQREALEKLEKLDPVTQDIVIGNTHVLEQFHWFIRAHLEDSSGHLSTDD